MSECSQRRVLGFLVQSWRLPRALCEGPGRTRRFTVGRSGVVVRVRRRLVAVWFCYWSARRTFTVPSVKPLLRGDR